MDRTYIDRYLVIDRYLAGELLESEEANFEERLVWDQELIEEIDLAGKLRDGLLASADETAPDKPATTSPLARAAAAPRLAIAASFAIGALTASLLFNQPAIMVADNNIPTSVVSLDLLRGSTEQQIAVTPGAMIVLMVVADGGFATYGVTVNAANNPEVIWTQSGLTPGYTGSLAVGINSGRIPPGNYLLNVYSDVDDASTLLRTIPFKSVLPE